MKRTHCALSESQVLELTKKDALPEVTHLSFDPTDAQAEALTTLRGVERLDNLVLLDLSNNAIAQVEYLHNGAHLQQLFLSDNLIREIPHFVGQLPPSPQPSLPRLKVLDLSGNRIQTVPSLIQLPQLQELNLERNQISKLASLAQLGGNPQLSVLLVAKNPLCREPFYIEFCLYHIPQLSELDGSPVRDEQRGRAFERFEEAMLWEEGGALGTDPANLLEEELDYKEQEIARLQKQLRRAQLERQQARERASDLSQELANERKKVAEAAKERSQTFSRLFELEQELAFHQLERFEPARSTVSLSSELGGSIASLPAGMSGDITKLREGLLVARKQLATLQNQRREVGERGDWVGEEVARLEKKTTELAAESGKLRAEADALKGSLSSLEERIKSRDQSPRHQVRAKKKKLKEALATAEELRERTLGLQRECGELKRKGDATALGQKQNEYDGKAKELDETTQLITRMEDELLEAKVQQKRRIMERLRVGGGASSRRDESDDLLNLSISAPNSANQSLVERENAELVQEHLAHTLEGLERLGKQLEHDSASLEKLLAEQKEIVARTHQLEQEMGLLQTQIEASETAIRSAKRKQLKEPERRKITPLEIRALCERLEPAGRATLQVARLARTGASRGGRLWERQIGQLEQQLRELPRAQVMKPLSAASETMGKVLRESAKVLRTFTGLRRSGAVQLERQREAALRGELERMTEAKEQLERSHEMTAEETRHYCEKLEAELTQAYSEVEQLQRRLDSAPELDPAARAVLSQIQALLGHKRLNQSALSGNIDAVQSPARAKSVETERAIPPVVGRRYSASLSASSIMADQGPTRSSLAEVLGEVREALGRAKAETEAAGEWREHKEKVLEFFEKETVELKASWAAIEQEKARLEGFERNLDEKYHQLKRDRDRASAPLAAAPSLPPLPSTPPAKVNKNEDIIAANFEREVESYRAELRKLKEQVGAVQRKKDKLAEELGLIRQESEAEGAKKEELRAAVERMESALAALKKQRRGAQEAVEQGRKELRSIDKERRRLGQEMREMEERRTAIEKRVRFEEETARADVEKLQRRYAEKQGAVQERQLELERLEDAVARKQEQLRVGEARLESVRQESEALSQQQLEVRTVGKRLEILRGQQEELGHRVQDLRRARDDAARELTEVRDEVRTRREQGREAEAELESALARKGEAERGARSWTREAEEREARANRMRQELEDLEMARERKQEAMATVEREMEEKQRSFQSFRGELVQYVKEMSEIRSDFEREKEELAGEITQAQQHQELVERHVRQKQGELSAVVAQLDVHQTQLEAKQDTANAELEHLQERINARRAQERQIMDSLERASSKMERARARQLESEEARNQAIEALGHLEGKIEEMETLSSEREAMLREKEENLANVKAEMGELEEKANVVHMELAILGQPVERRVQQRITEIVRRAGRAQQAEQREAQIMMDLQALQLENAALKEAAAEDGRLRTSSFTPVDVVTQRSQIMDGGGAVLTSVASMPKIQTSFAESFVNQQIDSQLLGKAHSVNLATPLKLEERKEQLHHHPAPPPPRSTFSPQPPASPEYSEKFFQKLQKDLKMMKEENSAIRRLVRRDERSRSTLLPADSTTFGANSDRAVPQSSTSYISPERATQAKEDATTQRARGDSIQKWLFAAGSDEESPKH